MASSMPSVIASPRRSLGSAMTMGQPRDGPDHDLGSVNVSLAAPSSFRKVRWMPRTSPRPKAAIIAGCGYRSDGKNLIDGGSGPSAAEVIPPPDPNVEQR